MKTVTILFLRRGDQVLLAMKKRGFGAGKWNGAGGKTEPGETPVQAASRECQEETGVTPHNPKLAGTIQFFDKADPAFGHHAHIYTATHWEGEPAETEEMRPQWFDVQELPFHQMWAADKLWIPQVLDGKQITGTITFNGETVVSHDIAVTNLP